MERPIIDSHPNGLHDSEAKGNADGEACTDARLCVNFHRSANLFDLAVDDIHSDAASGEAGYLVGR